MNQIVNQNFLAPPAETKAALFFLEGHYQLNWVEGSVERTKFLSPAQIGRAFTARDAFDSGWLEANVVRFAQEKKTHKILSCLPAGRRKIFITDPRGASERDDDGDEGESVLELEVPLPTLLLIGLGQKYFLWATLDKTVNQKSKICAAPFPNLNESGEICFGKNAAPECRLDTIEAVWRLILDSPFNSDRAAQRCRTHPEDARKFLFGLNHKKTFPKNALIVTNHTVGELWQAVR
jgi:hypothetical protein